jgi:hypothetical protein
MNAFSSAYRGDALFAHDVTRRNRHYDELEAWWRGDWQNDHRLRRYATGKPALYRDTLQLWRTASAVVNVYGQFVYAGPLSKDGEPLPDGTRGAIPLEPNTGGEQVDQQVIDAFSMIMNLWQWSQFKSLRPKTAAIFGDCLTELVEDIDRGSVTPNTLPPRDVTDLKLDDSGNVKAYTIERQVFIPASNAYGKPVSAQSYRFRKEVDGDALRYFKDDRPFDYGKGSVIENPYTFVAAVWDRHEIMAGEDYGIAATEKTLRQSMLMNSVMSHAMDYQQKQFSAPVGVKGTVLGRPGSTITMNSGFDSTSESEWDVEETRRRLAERMTLIQMGPDGDFVTVQSDLGQTREMLQIMMDSITAENPEATYGQQLLQMTQLTAPGVERALSPIVALVNDARSNADPQTIKLLQMGTAIIGMRLKNGDYPDDLVRARPDRYQPFAAFDLESYGRGLLECSVGPRPVFSETVDEKTLRLVQMIPIIESGDPWLMLQAGIPQEEIDRMVAEQEKRQQDMVASFSVAGAGNQDQGSTEATGPSGPSGPMGVTS